MRDEGLTVDLHSVSDDTLYPAGAAPVLFYFTNLEGTDPNITKVLYNVTPSGLFLAGSMMPRMITVSMAVAGVLRFDRNDGSAVIESDLSSSGLTDLAEFAVVSLLPQHDNNRLSRIEYVARRQEHWYYYHGVEEIYVSEPIPIVADEEAFSYNGRDSANLQSPPHVGNFSALVRQHQSEPWSWFTELLNRDHVITGQRVHMLVGDQDGNYDKAATGVMQRPQFTHRDNIYDWRVTADDPTALMVQNFANSTTLEGPRVPAYTVGDAILDTAQGYATQHNLDLYDVITEDFDAADFPVPLAWFWTNFESERNIFQRLVNTQGPPANFYPDKYGRLKFVGCVERPDKVPIGGPNGIPVSQVVSYTDHITDVVNDAQIPVSLHGWILPEVLESGESVSRVYEEPSQWMSPTSDELGRVAKQLFENYSSNALFNLARGTGGVVFGADGTYRFRVKTSNPVAPASGADTFALVPDTLTYTIDHIASNLIDIILEGTAGAAVPDFQLLGAELQHFRTIEAWASEDVIQENETQFSRYLYRLREFAYAGYTSIALQDAQLLADWVIRFYRRGLKTITLELFSSDHVRDAFRLVPDSRTPVEIANYGGGAPEQWVVRTVRHVFRDGHMWTQVTLDEDVMHSLGVEHSPLCAAYTAPDREQVNTARLNVDLVGVLLYEDSTGASAEEQALMVPEAGLVSNSPDLAATVLPIAATSPDPETVKTWPSGADLWQIDPGAALAAHYDFTRLEGLRDQHFWRSGLKANGMSLWLLDKKGMGNYWAMLSLNLRADNPVLDGVVLPAMYHFLRVRYTSLGAAQDVVYSFSTPRTTLADNTNHWLTVAQEQPWLSDDDAGVAHDLNERAILLEWRAYDSATMNTGLGTDDGSAKINIAVISQEAQTTADVAFEFANGQLNITRSFGVS